MLYAVVKQIFIILFSMFFRWRIEGLENVPSVGGVIIAPNHISNFDPPVVGSAMPRRVTFMAKEELFSPPWFGGILRRLGAFPIKRGAGDRAAIRTALELLAAGKALILFPEGTRSKTGELQRAQSGVAMIAGKSQVPVVPVAISGTNLMFKNGSWLPQVIIRFGQPVYPPTGDQITKETLEQFTATIMGEIATLQCKEV